MDDARPVPIRARFSRLQFAIGGLVVAFLVLTALVVAGRLDGLDHYALVHWMPGLDPAKANDTVPPVRGVFMPFDTEDPLWERLLDISTYPASVLVSLLVFLGGSAVL